MNVPRGLALASLLWLLGCQTGLLPPSPRTRLDDEGGLYVYLQPLGPETERLRFALDGVGALRADGTEVPLALALREVGGPETRRQRLLASGPLPAGEYAALVVRTGKAVLRGDSGDSALLVPDTPARVDARFTVRRGESGMLALALDHAASLAGGVRFSPAFSVFTPTRPAVGLMAFVTNARSNDVTVFDRQARQVFDVIATGRGPRGIAVDRRARRVYIGLSGDDAIEVIDARAGRRLDRIRLTPGDEPVDVALTPDGRTLLSANRGSNTVSVMDPESGAELEKVRVGSGPRAITIDRTGRLAFVLNELSNAVTVLDVGSRTVIRSIPTDPGPVQADFNRLGDRLYVVHDAVDRVSAISPTTFTVLRRFQVRTRMEAIRVDPKTDLVYLGSGRDLVMALYEPFGFGAVDFIETGAGVTHLAMDDEQNVLYVVTPDAGRVLAFDRIRKRLTGQIDVGAGPARVAIMGDS